MITHNNQRNSKCRGCAASEYLFQQIRPPYHNGRGNGQRYIFNVVLFHPTLQIIFSILGPQFGRPTEGVAGWLTSKILTRLNQVLEENAVMLCRISTDDTVLELGHGPGLGLEAAAKLLSGPRGRVLGIDYSEYMHQVASEKLQELIANGKVTLHHCDVASMPIAESSVDKVFHCNCYYFWPDLKKGTREIHRVMKPGG